jgi:hypothetical protein
MNMWKVTDTKQQVVRHGKQAGTGETGEQQTRNRRRRNRKNADEIQPGGKIKKTKKKRRSKIFGHYVINKCTE